MRRRFGPVLPPDSGTSVSALLWGYANYSRIFGGEGVALSLIDSARLAGVEHRWTGGLFPGNDLGQNNPEKNFLLDQLLARKAQSHLRVVCATPFQKRSFAQPPERFLCCVCMVLR